MHEKHMFQFLAQRKKKLKVRTTLSNAGITYYFVYSVAETGGNLKLPSFTIMLELTAHGMVVQFPRKASWNRMCAYVLLAAMCVLLCALCEAKRDLLP